jgi:hypothetical protein
MLISITHFHYAAEYLRKPVESVMWHIKAGRYSVVKEAANVWCSKAFIRLFRVKRKALSQILLQRDAPPSIHL